MAVDRSMDRVHSAVMGVDGCRGGWVGVIWDGSKSIAIRALTLAELVNDANTVAVTVIGVDMPMGLPDAHARQADRLAQRALGRRASSIFVTPTRSALAMPTQAQASLVNKEHGGPGVSIQAFNLRPKVLEVDEFLRQGKSDDSRRFVEVHPELSFQVMNDGPLEFSKRTEQGQSERQTLLTSVGIHVDPASVTVPGRVSVDDVLDAGAAAWSAFRVRDGHARCLPDPPEINSDGIPASIWV